MSRDSISNILQDRFQKRQEKKKVKKVFCHVILSCKPFWRWRMVDGKQLRVVFSFV